MVYLRFLSLLSAFLMLSAVGRTYAYPPKTRGTPPLPVENTSTIEDSTAMSFDLDEFVCTEPLDEGGNSRAEVVRRTTQKPEFLSVADAIRYFSGVQLKDYGGVGGLKR